MKLKRNFNPNENPIKNRKYHEADKFFNGYYFSFIRWEKDAWGKFFGIFAQK